MTTDVETGVLTNRSGRRMIALTNDFLIGLHRALERECGDKNPKVLHHCGRRWGTNFGKGLDEEWSLFYEQSAREFPIALFQSLLLQEFAYNGWGVLSVHYNLINSGIVWLSLEGAIMADIVNYELKQPADLLTAGILAGLFSHFLGREVDCFQSQCARQGFIDSRFVLSDPKRIEQLRSSPDTTKSHDAAVEFLLSTTA